MRASSPADPTPEGMVLAVRDVGRGPEEEEDEGEPEASGRTGPLGTVGITGRGRLLTAPLPAFTRGVDVADEEAAYCALHGAEAKPQIYPARRAMAAVIASGLAPENGVEASQSMIKRETKKNRH